MLTVVRKGLVLPILLSLVFFCSLFLFIVCYYVFVFFFYGFLLFLFCDIYVIYVFLSVLIFLFVLSFLGFWACFWGFGGLAFFFFFESGVAISLLRHQQPRRHYKTRKESLPRWPSHVSFFFFLAARLSLLV